MTPRPIHKWKTFWLGLLILAFLTWSWSRSLSYNSYAAIRTGPLTWHGINSSGAKISYTTTTYRRYLEPSRTVFGSHRFSHYQKPIWFPAPLKIGHEPNSIADQYRCSIAYWLIILLFLISWYAFLLWRRWKAKRLTAQPTPQAEPTP